MLAQVHDTVLLKPAVDALVTNVDGLYVDGTFGRGGHSREILARLTGAGRLMAIDKDPDAVLAASSEFAHEPRFSIHRGSFAQLSEILQQEGALGSVSGVLLDLGVSSPQLDQAQRGFSFTQDGPLDMRMNPDAGQSAAEWLASASETEIADVIYRYGEERFSRRMAKAIVIERKNAPITTTLRLAEIVKQANPAWEKNKHPATRAFQAIRIHVNRELEDLAGFLAQILDVLAIGGRMVVISFHSLEDRLVKQFIAEQVRGDDFPMGVPVRYAALNPRMKKIGKAVKADPQETAANPRARSAIMRIAERIA
jgi:16S rRNA (cytosine1402-N4)-methyltransferase